MHFVCGFCKSNSTAPVEYRHFPDDQIPTSVRSLGFANICDKKRPAPNANSRYERQLQRNVEENTMALYSEAYAQEYEELLPACSAHDGVENGTMT